MKVGGKKPGGRPRLRWMDRGRSDLKQHQLDPKFAQNREGWRKAIMAIDPGQGSVASSTTRAPIDNISFGAPVGLVTTHCVVFRILRVFRIVWMVLACCIILFSCDLISTAKFLGLPDTLLVHPLCPDEREHDPSGCQASGLTPELPVHVVLVPPLLVSPLLRLQALVPGVPRQPHRHFYFIDCPRKFLVFARCGCFEKALDFTRAGSRFLQHQRHTGADVYPTDTLQRSWTRYTLIVAYTTDNSYSGRYVHYPASLFNDLNWVNPAAVVAIWRLGSTTSNNAAAQQGEPLLALCFGVARFLDHSLCVFFYIILTN